MICDKVLFKGETILTVYHKGVREESKNRYIKRCEKIGRYNLQFTESFVDDVTVPNDWIQKTEGLLDPKSSLNPYIDGVCAHMTQYCFANKPKRLFKLESDEYSLRVPIDSFLLMCDFTKKFTGVDVESNPMLFGDVLIFKPFELELKSNKKENVVIKNLPADSLIVVLFKRNGVIVSSKYVQIDSEIKELEIECDQTWDSHDIELFQRGTLLFYKRDVSYMRRADLQIRFTTKEIVKLKRIGSDYCVEKTSSVYDTHLGEKPDFSFETIHKSENKIKKLIKMERPDDQVQFIMPGELDAAQKLIGRKMESAQKELWLFDPYFSDRNGIPYSMDWIRIMAHCKAEFKNIVFYCNSQTSLNLEELLDRIKNDEELKTLFMTKKAVGIKLHQVKKPIHDRFLLIRNNNDYSGLSIGTSFNSLHDNFYCISHLSRAASKKIITDLVLWMQDDNVKICEEF